MGRSPCPARNGAGELDLQIPKDQLTICKFCGGQGAIAPNPFSPFDRSRSLCPTCKGLVQIERPRIESSSGGLVKVTQTHTPHPSEFEFDVAISHAGEDQTTVKPYAEKLYQKTLKIFFADFEKDKLWGANLYETFDSIY